MDGCTCGKRFRCAAENEGLTTHFAPAERASREEVQSAAALVDQELLRTVLDGASIGAVVLNAQRQILFANGQFSALTVEQIAGQLRGDRPGEALGCVNAWRNPAGCGTSELCPDCGAAVAMLAALQDGAEVQVQECSLTVQRDGEHHCHEYRVKATPLQVQGLELLVVYFEDITEQKRREALERLFFHDVLNTVTALRGYSALHQLDAAPDHAAAMERIATLCRRLEREIAGQRALLDAERGRLQLHSEPVSSTLVLERVAADHSGQATVAEQQLVVRPLNPPLRLVTDLALVSRVLGNMVKNAIEAGSSGDVVTVGAEASEERCRFWVHNVAVMPDEVARQLFKRSFSTRGRGRGLGTYSMKLFGERYLGGEVGFNSTDPGGTTVWLTLPCA